MEDKIKVIELFAGVEGFCLGLEGWQKKSASSKYREDIESPYEIVWSNQWEPSTKVQHASMVYEQRWNDNKHSNKDISTVEITEIPDHDMLVGGFPCQDYSVATTLKNSKGLIGKKGVLWWSIHKIISEKENKPKYLFLENVDRLLISPTQQRGRDFAIILKSLNDLGYAVEWRVINAADYGMPQRRKRVFILAYLKDSIVYNDIKDYNSTDWLLKDGTLAKAFPVQSENILFPKEFKLKGDIVDISENFNKNGITGMFENSGFMMNSIVTTIKTTPVYEDNFMTLKDIIQDEEVPEEFYINDEDLDKWMYLKGAKKEMRKNSQGFEYHFIEGGMILNLGVTLKGRAIRSNLFFVPQKRISTSIPNAKTA